MMIGLKLVFEDTGKIGGICVNCKQEITGNVFQAMNQVGSPFNATPIDNFIVCEECRDHFLDTKKGAKP